MLFKALCSSGGSDSCNANVDIIAFILDMLFCLSIYLCQYLQGPNVNFASMKHENCYLIIVEIQSFSDNEVEHVFHGMLGISLFGKLHICTSWHVFL